MTLSFPANESPGMGWLPVSGGQASQCLPGCALQMTMSLGRMSCGFRSEICKALLGVWVGVVQVVDQGKLVEAQAVEPVVYNPDAVGV